MKFDLLLTNKGRVRGALWALLLSFAVSIALVALGAQPAFWLLMAVPLLLLGILPFWNKLFCQPARVLLEDDSISWANPADSAPEFYPFADVRAYRFDLSRIAVHLTLYLRTGEQESISGRLHQEFWTMEEAFKQVIRRYNQAHPGAEVAQEPEALEKYFTSPLSTKVLWALLALGAAGVAWGTSHDAPGPAYLPLLLIILPYLLVWANFYYERTPPAPANPIEATATFSVWLTNSGRDGGWEGLVFIVVIVGIGMLTISLSTWLATRWQFGVAGVFAGLVPWLIGAGVAMKRFAKWSNDPASITLEADQLIVRSEVVEQQASVPFAEIKDYNTGSFRDSSWLRIERRDGSKIKLQATYASADFLKMTAEFERRFRAYQWQQRPPRTAPRR